MRTKSPQQIEIEHKREHYKIRPVELGEMPGFFMRRVCRYTRGWGRLDAESGLNWLSRHTTFRIFDHWGKSTTVEGLPCFATEPYRKFNDENHETWEVTRTIAHALGLDFLILNSRQSWWFPDHTIRIEFFECSHVPRCEGSMNEQSHRQMCKELRG